MWDAALLVARTQVEAVLADRALNGVEVPHFYKGELVGTVGRVRNTELIFIAGRGAERLRTLEPVAA